MTWVALCVWMRSERQGVRKRSQRFGWLGQVDGTDGAPAAMMPEHFGAKCKLYKAICILILLIFCVPQCACIRACDIV